MNAIHETMAERVIELSPEVEARAHPAARFITQLSSVAVDRQITQFNNLDIKASFLGGSTFALLAGFLTALATKPPTTQRLGDLAAVALTLAAVTLGCVGYTWWPRPVDVPPHPRGLREQHWTDSEEEVLRAVSDAISTTYDTNKKVETKKVWGIRLGILSLAGAALSGSIDILFIAGIGGGH
jgi:hypothetical protein